MKKYEIYTRIVHVDVKKPEGLVTQRTIDVQYKKSSSNNVNKADGLVEQRTIDNECKIDSNAHKPNFAYLDARLRELVKESGIAPYNNRRV